MKLNYLKALWDIQGKIKMYYGMSRVKNELSGNRSIETRSCAKQFNVMIVFLTIKTKVSFSLPTEYKLRKF